MDEKIAHSSPVETNVQHRPVRGDELLTSMKIEAPDRLRTALSPEDRRALDIARRGMDFYRNALTELAK